MMITKMSPVTLFMCISIIGAAGQSQKENFLVLTFSPKETKAPRALVLDAIPTLREFTLCHWVRPLAKRNDSTIVHYLSPADNSEFISIINAQANTVQFGINKKLQSFSCALPLMKWQHLCFTWDSTGSGYFYLNGGSQSSFKDFQPGERIDRGGEMYYGNKQYPDGSDEFNKKWNAFADVSAVNIWSPALCSDKIRTLATCRETIEGNVIPWGKTSLALADDAEIKLINKSFCDTSCGYK